jgi:hypothetical protein
VVPEGSNVTPRLLNSKLNVDLVDDSMATREFLSNVNASFSIDL